MALDFPNSPSIGAIYSGGGGGGMWQWDGAKWESIGVAGASRNVTVSDTAPPTPNPGDMWFDSVGLQLYVYYQDPTSSQWVPANNLTWLPPTVTGTGATYVMQSNPTINQPIIMGVTDGSNAVPGARGEYINVANTPPYVTFSGPSTYQNILSFTLQPGDWDLQGTWQYASDGTVWNMMSSISSTSLTMGSQVTEFAFGGPGTTNTGHWSGNTSITPLTRWNVTVPTTLYLVGFVGGWAYQQNGTYIRGTGYVQGRRVR